MTTSIETQQITLPGFAAIVRNNNGIPCLQINFHEKLQDWEKELFRSHPDTLFEVTDFRITDYSGDADLLWFLWNHGYLPGKEADHWLDNPTYRRVLNMLENARPKEAYTC